MTPERWLAKPRAKGKRCPGCDERAASPVPRFCHLADAKGQPDPYCYCCDVCHAECFSES